MNTIPERAASYLESMPPAIAGSGGHASTFAAAVALVKGFNLDEQEALPFLAKWNTRCLPPWTESDLRYKLRNAAASSSKPAGYLLGDSATPARERTAPSFEREAEKKARLRNSWPTFRPPSKAEIESISRLRCLPGSAVRVVADAKLLSVCHYERTACFVMMEDSFAQARRLDGEMLPIRDGVSKAKNLPGSVGAFIGAGLLGESPNVLLVEGCIGLLEALGCISLANVEGWTAIASTSASSRFARAPGLLARLKGRRVRIVPDDDEAGLEAASTWLADLENAGASVDVLKVPPGCKDLGPIVSDSFTHQLSLTSLFQ